MNEAVVKPYLQLREELSRRDKSLREKVVTLEDATSFVQDGMSVGIGGSTMSRTPMAMIWALIRARKKHLSCSRSIVSTDGDLLFGSGVCDHMITSWFAQSILWGLSKVMRHHIEKGSARYDEWNDMAVGMRFRAGAMGVPFMPIRSMLGSDVLKQRPEAKEIDCPFTGEKLLLVPALNPDVALIHVQRCDAYGNAQIDGLQFMDIDLAMAANRVILDDGAHRFERPDPPRARPDQDPVLLRRRGGRSAVRMRPARMLRRLRADDAAHGDLRRAGEWRSNRRPQGLPRPLCLRAEILDRVFIADRHGRSARCDAPRPEHLR